MLKERAKRNRGYNRCGVPGITWVLGTANELFLCSIGHESSLVSENVAICITVSRNQIWGKLFMSLQEQS